MPADMLCERDQQRRIVAAARGGDREAFARLVEGCQTFRKLCRRLARNPEDAEDLEVEALYRAMRHIGSFTGTTQAQFARWLNRITVNTWLDMRRARRQAASLEELGLADYGAEEPEPGDVATGKLYGTRLFETAREELRASCTGSELWQCLALRLEGWPYEEIAEVLGDTAKQWRDRYSEVITPALTRVRLRMAFGGGAVVPGWKHADYELYRRRAELGETYADAARLMKRQEDGLRKRWVDVVSPAITGCGLHERVLNRTDGEWTDDDRRLFLLRLVAGHEYGERDGSGRTPYGDDADAQRQAWIERIAPVLTDVVTRMGLAEE